ncbi:hypothetical protein HPB50_008050 [Hyalomma asiaticum]|uniref:Uncharacterized protein n=1 Tax=Hyalomma asiaticum TaxID=266040 RepID=A0ACB7TEC6_HYAAI|nr:hypothetical protein HPB50_008050 [Hyalomma asiaticum]
MRCGSLSACLPSGAEKKGRLCEEGLHDLGGKQESSGPSAALHCGRLNLDQLAENVSSKTLRRRSWCHKGSIVTPTCQMASPPGQRRRRRRRRYILPGPSAPDVRMQRAPRVPLASPIGYAPTCLLKVAGIFGAGFRWCGGYGSIDSVLNRNELVRHLSLPSLCSRLLLPYTEGNGTKE